MDSPLTPVAIANGLIDIGGSNPRLFGGYSLRATTAGQINIRDGSVTGQIIATLDLALNVSTGIVAFPRLIATASGIFVQVVSGVYVGSVFVA